MKIFDALKKAEFVVIVAAFITMVAAIFAQVLNRNFVKLSIGWIEELARYCMVVLVMFGAEVGLRTGGQLSMEIVTSRMKGLVKKAAAIVVQVLVTAFSCIVFYGSIPLVQAQLKSMQLSPGLRLPMAVPYGVVMATFTIVSIVQIVVLVRMIIFGDKHKEEAA